MLTCGTRNESDRGRRSRRLRREDVIGGLDCTVAVALPNLNVACAISLGWARSRMKNAGGSYLSSHDPREVLGIGKAERMDWIEIAWPRPSTTVQRISNPALDRYLTVRE